MSILPEVIITELSNQLRAWRDHLPPALSWHDDSVIGNMSQDAESEGIELRHGGLPYKMLDPVLLLNSSLQTRYKFTMYLIYRPYIYKALHKPEAVTAEDLEGCKTALLVCSYASIFVLLLTWSRHAPLGH
jgi:hypothetical protein